MSKLKLFLTYLVVVVVVVGLGFWLFKISKPKNPADLPGQTIPELSRGHIPSCTVEKEPYNSNPPTSGCHDPVPLDWGIYKTTQPDEKLVHNLEHGGIWISYKPDKVDADTIKKLEDFANRYKLIIVEPRPADDAPIALVAWGHLENLDQFDETAILKFIEAFHNKGPEKVM